MLALDSDDLIAFNCMHIDSEPKEERDSTSDFIFEAGNDKMEETGSCLSVIVSDEENFSDKNANDLIRQNQNYQLSWNNETKRWNEAMKRSDETKRWNETMKRNDDEMKQWNKTMKQKNEPNESKRWNKPMKQNNGRKWWKEMIKWLKKWRSKTKKQNKELITNKLKQLLV